MYALDTSTVVDYLRGRGRVGERLLATPSREIALPTIVLYELELGAEKAGAPAERRAELAELFETVTLLAFDEAEAKAAARIRADLEASGLPIGPYDVLIAATALARGAILVTHNREEFSRVAGLRLEDWY
ncbi:MAG TPA: type II toxin-antitoxin system VapC family toxin [Thermoanaerobaculia bacterium]|nr:type II toxin-antitoxin system VapC family toxin [Thermoanaerobaculia bacterium]